MGGHGSERPPGGTAGSELDGSVDDHEYHDDENDDGDVDDEDDDDHRKELDQPAGQHHTKEEPPHQGHGHVVLVGSR